METAPFIEGVRADLEGLAAADEATVVERIARALEPALQLRLFDAIGQAALELSEQLGSGHVDVRLAGRDVQLVFVGGGEPPAQAQRDDEEGTARLTLRMPEGLKVRVEGDASRQGISTNAWLVAAVKRALDFGPRRRTGTRITGFAQG